MPLAFLGSALQHWKLALGLFMAVYIGFLHLRVAGEKIHSAKVETRLRQSNAAYAKLESDIRSKTELARAKDAADSAQTETRDLKRAMETNDALRKDIAAVRARLADRMRAGTTTADPSRGGISPVPSSSGSTPSLAGAGGGAFIPTDDLRICAENTLKAKAAREFLMGR
jgi:hypothetical protein